MITCDTCGCLVDPEMLQEHSDWHDELVKRSDLPSCGSVANPDRVRVQGDEGFEYVDC